MFSCRRSTISLRLGAVLIFLSYVLAGAAFLLPVSAAGARCPHASKSSSVTPGMSCPLSARNHHCPHSEGKPTTSKIVMCPDGCCLLSPGEGAVTSPVKFLPAKSSLLFIESTMQSVAEKERSAPSELSYPPPYHPPPTKI